MSDVSRDATATIKGYMYQFDASIIAALSLKDDETLDIEGIEDYDTIGPTFSNFTQCKHYASQNLTDSVIRDAIEPMLSHFCGLADPQRSTALYTLYGHYSNSTTDDEKTYDKNRLKEILQRKKKNDDNTFTTIDVAALAGASDDLLEEFSSKFRLKTGPSYEEQKTRAINAIQSATSSSHDEAHLHYYPTALTHIAEIACQKDSVNRKTTKAKFIEQIRKPDTVFASWLIRANGQKRYAADVKKALFSNLNISPHDNFFLFENCEAATDSDIHHLALHLASKMSTHNMRRTLPQERRAPYLLFENLTDKRLASLKTALLQDGIKLVDGYPFREAEFTVANLCEPQTLENKIAIRIVGDRNELGAAMDAVQRPRNIFHFYMEAATRFDCRFKINLIGIDSLSMAEDII